MTQNSSLNTKFSNLQLSKLKSGRKNDTEVTLNLSLNVVAESNDETANFPHKLIHTFWDFVKPLQFIYQLIYNFRRPNCQKQLSRGVHIKGCSENMQHICRRFTMPKFIEISFWRCCFSVNLVPFFQNNFS